MESYCASMCQEHSFWHGGGCATCVLTADREVMSETHGVQFELADERSRHQGDNLRAGSHGSRHCWGRQLQQRLSSAHCGGVLRQLRMVKAGGSSSCVLPAAAPLEHSAPGAGRQPAMLQGGRGEEVLVQRLQPQS